MTDEPTSDLSKPKPRRKPAKKRARAKPTSAPKRAAGVVYAGLTAAACASSCTAERCVITHRGVCGHPYKGGLQATAQSPEASRRLNEAKRVIGQQKLDLTVAS